MNVSHPNRAQELGCSADGGDQEALVERAQIEASVEAIAKCGKVACCVLSEVERMEATVNDFYLGSTTSEYAIALLNRALTKYRLFRAVPARFQQLRRLKTDRLLATKSVVI